MDKEAVVRLFEEHGAVYYSVTGRGTGIGKIRVSFKDLPKEVVSEMLEELEKFEGKGSVSGWEVIQSKGARFAYWLADEVEDEGLKKQLELYVLAFSVSMGVPKMNAKLKEAREGIALAIKGMRGDRRLRSVGEVTVIEGRVEEVIEEVKVSQWVPDYMLRDHRLKREKFEESQRERLDAEREAKRIADSWANDPEWLEIQARKKVKREKEKREMVEKFAAERAAREAS